MFTDYTVIEVTIFKGVKQYFEALPPGSDEYKNAFYDVVAQYGSGGESYVMIGDYYDELINSAIFELLQKLSPVDKTELKKIYEFNFLENYLNEKGDGFAYSDEDLAGEIKVRFKSWVDDNFNLDDMLHDDDKNDNEVDDDDEDVFSMAERYTSMSISNLLTDIIKGFTTYNISPKQLPVIATMLMVISDLKKYTVNGYIYFWVKEKIDADNSQCRVIHLDQDGLRISIEGFITIADNGGDSYTNVIFPCNDEEYAMNIVGEIDNFVSDFIVMLGIPGIEIEAFDSGDGVVCLN